MSEEIWRHVQSAPNFIAQDLHLQQELFERNKSRKLNLKVKNKQNKKNDLQLRCVQIGGYSWNLHNG
jgi:hypothetical protein